ncbi:hypothetical protein D3C75_1162760 [compost metagenome]
MAAEGRQDLGVDHRCRQRLEGIQKHLQIFATGVQEFHYGGIGQQVDKGLPLLDGERIDQGKLFTII